MKGQSEIIVFILLFVIGVSLFLSAVVWSRGIFEKNSDVTKLNSIETFMSNLDDKIQGVIKFGGKDSINYNLDATIELVDSGTIEISTPLSVNIPETWVKLKEDGSIIRERMEGDILKVQLQYLPDSYAVHLYTDGPIIATPRTVFIEKGSSFESEGRTYIRVKVTFE